MVGVKDEVMFRFRVMAKGLRVRVMDKGLRFRVRARDFEVRYRERVWVRLTCNIGQRIARNSGRGRHRPNPHPNPKL